MRKICKQVARKDGQTLILIMLALPLFFALMSLVIDGGNILVHKRNIQVAADAAALAVAQNIDLASSPPHTCGTYNGQTGNPACNALAAEYSSKNGVNASIHKCNDADPTHPTDTNCWAYPYVDTSNVTHDGSGSTDPEVEVRLQAPVTTFFVGAADALLHGGVSTTFSVSARAVAQTNQILGVSTIPGQTFTGSTTTIPGGTHTVTDMSTISNGSGVAFAMSGACDSISYSGAGSGTWNDQLAAKPPLPGTASVLGAIATNGGINFQGTPPKKITWLGFDQTRCMNAPNHDPDSPPSGTNQCTARAWRTPPGSGTDADDSRNNCVQTLVNLNQTVAGQPWRPINWPLPPPTVPQPQTGPFDPATYPSKCSDVTSRAGGNNVVNVDVSDLATWPAGIYCVTGGKSFQISGAESATSAGHTFFARDGGTISVSSNSTLLKYYWPASCGPRPQPTDPRQSCVPGYDPYTLLYATFASANGNCAVCLQGQNGSITGDIFATQPNAFPPTPTQTQTGGLVKVSGGALAAGVGFIESWNLQIAGNTGTYQGTGAGLVIPGATHTTTDSSTTIIVPGSTGAATTVATTIGTNLDLSQ